MGHQARAYSGFYSMKGLGVFLTPGWVASASQGYPPLLSLPAPFIHLGGGGIVSSQSKVSCQRTKLNVPGQGSNVDRSPWSRAH